MEIALQTQVECTDGVCGKSVFVLINPVTEKVTHLVVRAAETPNAEYIVPMDFVSEPVDGSIHLSCSKAEFEKLDPFIQKRFIEEKVPEYIGSRINGMASSYYWPYVSPDITVYESVDDQQIPAGEMSVCRGTRVEATDGYVGHVDEFMVNPENGSITHLVMREGHLWGQKDVIIPLSAMGDTKDDTVFLKIDKHQIEALPTFPVQRRWS